MSQEPDLQRPRAFMPFDCLTESHPREIQGQFAMLEPPLHKGVFNSGKGKTGSALTAGCFLGEDTLIPETERNATGPLTSDGVLMCLSREPFRELLGKR